MPTINLQINEYATSQHPFLLKNNTNTNLDPLLINTLIVNTEMSSSQPIVYVENVTYNANSRSGLVFNNWTSPALNQLILLYNDSALLSMPYLIHTLTNFYARLEGSGEELINATLSPWPRTTANTIQNLDYSIFTTLIVLGTGLVLPLSSFASEIVQDREVNIVVIYGKKPEIILEFFIYYRRDVKIK